MRCSHIAIAFAVAGAGLTGGLVSAQQPAASPAVGPAATQFSCDASDPRLRACYTFDGDTRDRSSYGNHANAANVSYVAGKS